MICSFIPIVLIRERAKCEKGDCPQFHILVSGVFCVPLWYDDSWKYRGAVDVAVAL